MNTHPEPPALADLTALKLSGPAIVFVRPRLHLSADATEVMARQLERLSRGFTDVRFALLPADVDIMAISDTDLEHYGLARLTPAT